MHTSGTQPDLGLLWRKVTARMIQLTTELMDRPSVPWEFRSIEQQLTVAFGFRPVAEARYGELVTLLLFCDQWLELLPVSADAYWADPAYDDE